ncbi:MAG: transporter permease [Candidatus Taylorbacteria bacterium]|nr:transporter permease [Candidatus Taylorbacteria bacterium]
MKYRIYVALILITIWQLIHYLNTFLIPSPYAVIKVLPHLLSDPLVLVDIRSTLIRIIEAFIISICFAVPVGLILGRFKKLYSSVSYILDFFRSTPATAIFPLFLIMFGVGDIAKVISAAFASFIIITFNLAEGIRHINKYKLLTLKVMGANNMEMIQKVIFWESLPHLFIGLRNGISTSVIVIVVTEMFVGTVSGIGKQIVDYQITYEIPSMYGMIFIIGTIGYLINRSIMYLEKNIVHWHNK